MTLGRASEVTEPGELGTGSLVLQAAAAAVVLDTHRRSEVL